MSKISSLIYSRLMPLVLVLLVQSCAHQPEATHAVFDTGAASFSKSEMTTLGLLVDRAYTQFRDNKNVPNPDFPSSFVNGFEPIANIHSSGSLRLVPPEFFGFIVRSEAHSNVLVLALRGTADADDWAAEVNFRKVAFDKNDATLGEVEKGFHTIFSTLKISLPSDGQQLAEAITLAEYLSSSPQIDELIVVGHSLGSSLASLMAMDMLTQHNFSNVHLLAFAPPRTGDQVFADAVKKRIKRGASVINPADLVPRMPFRWMGFRQLSHIINVDFSGRSTLKKNPICSHSLRSYLYALNESIQPEDKCLR